MKTRMPRTARPLVATLALVGLITTGAACSSSHPSSAAKSGSTTSSAAGGRTAPETAAKTSGRGGPNPCTIVTAAEVQAITGASATPKGPTEAYRGTNCTWDPANGASVLVQVFHGKEFYSPSIQAPKATKLTGLGDDAYLDAFGTTRVGVGFLKGDVAVFIDGMQVTSANAVVAAARDAVSKV